MFDFNEPSYSYGLTATRLRQMFELFDRSADNPVTPDWREVSLAGRRNINMPELEKNVINIATYAAVLLQAFKNMQQEPALHPITAFVRASKSPEVFGNGAHPLDDNAFIVLLSQWRSLCSAAKPTTLASE